MVSKVLFSRVELRRPSLGRPIQFNVTLTGGPTGHPGVTALLLRDGELGLGWCLLADHPENHGVTVTNGAIDYAEAVCRALERPRLDFVWFQLDSDGAFDELHLLGDDAGFAPLNEPGAKPRSMEAFLLRASRVFTNVPAEFTVAVSACSMRFGWRTPE